MPDISEANVRDALSRVCASEEFAASPRLRDFLSWVIGEWLSGSAAGISGKAIAVEVYGRTAADDESGLNLVRVEARRLRRRLDRYYELEGEADPWRIRIDKGGYTPRFEERSVATTVTEVDGAKKTPFKLAVIALAAAALALVVETLIPGRHSAVPVNDPATEASAAKRSAIGARSTVSLQAVNLSNQARGLLFPAFDMKQQEIALSMFRHVVELDPGLHHGYAGSAQVLGVMALLEADETSAKDLLQEARSMARAGLDRAPTDAWAMAASAWVQAVSGSTGEAMRLTNIALDLAPEDGHVLDLAGITAIVAGNGTLAAAVSDPARPRGGVPRFGANNVWGVSQYMVGNYASAADAFAGAAEAGASISAPSLIFLAVASDHAGESEQAAAAVRELRRSYPNFPLPFVVSRMFQNRPEYRDDILERIEKYGYQARVQ